MKADSEIERAQIKGNCLPVRFSCTCVDAPKLLPSLLEDFLHGSYLTMAGGREPDFKQTFDLEKDLLSAEEARECLIQGEDIVKLPVTSVTACANLDEYFARSTAKKKRTSSCSSSRTSSCRLRDSSASISRPEQPLSVPLVRNFDRILKKPNVDCHQESSALLNIISRPRQKKPDLFSRLDKLDQSKGPLLHLKRNVDKTVKVLIRRRRKVPYISRTIEYKGTLVLFDKHMNLFLRDVIESFKYHLNGKLMKRARHRDKVFIRGDNVILVSERENQHRAS